MRELFAVGLALAAFLGGASGLVAQGSSPRSTERVKLDCESRISWQEITLFANGTVRLRERSVPQGEVESSRLGPRKAPGEGETRMFLGDLDGDLLRFYLDRLRAEDLSEVRERPGSGISSVGGDWVEQCTLHLALPGRSPRRFSFGRLDSLPLTFSRLVKIVEELPTYVVDEDSASPRIPLDYRPQEGDVLERKDGQRFTVAGRTTDGAGLELRGVDVPLTVYIAAADLRQEFRALIQRAGAVTR